MGPTLWLPESTTIPIPYQLSITIFLPMQPFPLMHHFCLSNRDQRVGSNDAYLVHEQMQSSLETEWISRIFRPLFQDRRSNRAALAGYTSTCGSNARALEVMCLLGILVKNRLNLTHVYFLDLFKHAFSYDAVSYGLLHTSLQIILCSSILL
jgi:hypothetical protein